MLIWILIQSFINILLGVGLFIMWSKYRRPPQEDPRLSRGLQLLQSKISVLEDLSDRTETQVKQLNQLMDQRAKQVRKAILDSETAIQRIGVSMKKSLDVAEIFEDKIPHSEIIERQNTRKYVQAAKLANQGKSIDEILQVVDIPRGELEFIVKVNRDQLMFDDQMLPAWALTEQPPTTAEDSLKKIGDQFRQACADFDQKQKKYDDQERMMREKKEQIFNSAKNISHKIIDSTEGFISDAGSAAKTISSEVFEKTEQLAKNLSSEMLNKTENLTRDLFKNTQFNQAESDSIHQPERDVTPASKVASEIQAAALENISFQMPKNTTLPNEGSKLTGANLSNSAKNNSSAQSQIQLNKNINAGGGLNRGPVANGRTQPGNGGSNVSPGQSNASHSKASNARPVAFPILNGDGQYVATATKPQDKTVKKVVFPKMNMDDQLG